MHRVLLAPILFAAVGCLPGSGADTTPSAAPEEPRLVCVGHVDVEGGVTALRPVRTGRVVEIAVREGQEVRAGAVLLRLDGAAAEIGVRQAEANVKAARLRLAQARKMPAEHEHDLAAQRAAVTAAQSRLDATRHTLARKQDLRRRDLLSAEELHVAEDVVREMEASALVEKQKLERLAVSDPEDQVAQAEADLEVKTSQLEDARQALSECTLRAPADGDVLRVVVSRGEVLTTQTALLFCLRQPRIVRAEVPQEFAAGVAVGQIAVLEDDSRTGQTWKGKVVRVSDWFTQRRSVLLEPQQRNDVRTLECIILPEPDEKPLRIGQRMRVLLSPK